MSIRYVVLIFTYLFICLFSFVFIDGGERQRRIQLRATGCGGGEERTDEDSDGEEEQRDVPRRQLGAGEGADHRRASLPSEEALRPHHSHKSCRSRQLHLGFVRGGAPEAAAPVHQVYY